MIEKIKKTLKTSHRAAFGGGILLSRNDRVLGDSQHSQVESSQAEKISLQAFRSQRGMLGEGSTEIDNLQSETSNSEKLPLPAGEGMGEGSTEIDNLQSETSNSEKLPLPPVEGVLDDSFIIIASFPFLCLRFFSFFIAKKGKEMK